MKHVSILFITFLFQQSLWAQATPELCTQAQWENGGQQMMNQCALVEYQVADQKLNEVWKTVRSCVSQAEKENFLPVEMNPMLLETQRAWIKWKDQQCEFDAKSAAGGWNEDDFKGSMWPMVYNGCLARLTKDRVSDLQQMLGEMGDLCNL